MSDTTPIPPASERERLLPCPFCGLVRSLKVVSAEELASEGDDDPDPWEHSDSYAVVCDASRPDGPGGCGAQGGFKLTVTEAIENWNRRAALSHPSTPQGWQPIESAPKDGTPIIIANILEGTVFDVCNGNFEVVEEDEEDGPWDIRGGEPWCSYVGRAAGTYFCTWLPGYEREDRWRVTDSFEYTHWIPLPPPPEQGGKG